MAKEGIAIIIMATLLLIGVAVSELDSSDLDAFNCTNHQILERNTTTWKCVDHGVINEPLTIQGTTNITTGLLYIPNLKKCSDMNTNCSNEDALKVEMPTGRICCG